MKQAEFVKISQTPYWQPDKIGQTFQGKITSRHVGETKYGMKPFIELTDTKTGEAVCVITGNLRLRKLNCYPLNTMAQLKYLGTEKALIGGKRKEIAIMEAYIVKGSKAGEDFTGGKYYGKDKEKSPRKRKSKGRASKH